MIDTQRFCSYADADVVKRAMKFATQKHDAQYRKYTGEDYIHHPWDVVNILKTIPHTNEMLAAAWLHDVLEDTDCEYEELGHNFGWKIADLVLELTDVSTALDGVRHQRKEIDRQHTAKACADAKTIKLADLISNTKSIVEHDKKFAKIYVKEKELLLEVLTEGNMILYNRAKELVENAKKELEI